MALAAIWLRGRSLGNIPGINGDEAWYGVQAWRMLHEATIDWHTPTGNPLSPLFIGPLALLHLWLPPSIVLLRSVALASGLAALVINWFCCRWVFDRRTAAISTVVLAILPINIAYSRFAWDASQSLAATLPVVYFALAAVRYPRRYGLWIAASLLALAVAFWVHPTNIFAGAAPLVAFVARFLPARDDHQGRPEASSWMLRALCLGMLLLAGLLAATWLYAGRWTHGPLPGRIGERLGQLGGLNRPCGVPPVSVLYPRLFTGGTVYRYIAGSRSWFEWPLPAELEGGGLDVGVFWAAVAASVWLVWRSNRWRFRNDIDGVLVAAWVLQLAAFLVAAGPQAMAPGWERFALGLIGPAVLVLSRGAALAWEAVSPRWRTVLVVATLAGWALLADFHAHYFRFIEHTGGQAHLTFRTAAEEPKQAALQYILEQAKDADAKNGKAKKGKEERWIVSSEWWISWPIRYLASPYGNVYVPDPSRVGASGAYRQALAQGRVWFVEFYDTPAEHEAESQLAGKTICRQRFSDYGDRPLLSVLHAVGP